MFYRGPRGGSKTVPVCLAEAEQGKQRRRPHCLELRWGLRGLEFKA